jgi:DNA repair exonuclease SbcCD ATPase subunit
LPVPDRKTIFKKKYGKGLDDKALDYLLNQYALYTEKTAKTQLKALEEVYLDCKDTIDQNSLHKNTQIKEKEMLEKDLIKDFDSKAPTNDSGIAAIQSELNLINDKLYAVGNLSERKEFIEDFIGKLKARARDVLVKINSPRLKDAIDDLDARINDTADKLASYTSSSERMNQVIQLLEKSSTTGICELCGGDFDGKDVTDRKVDLKAKVREIDTKYTVLHEEHKEIEETLAELRSIRTLGSEKQAELEVISERYEDYQKLLADKESLREKLAGYRSVDTTVRDTHLRAEAKIEEIDRVIGHIEKKNEELQKQAEQLSPKLEEMKVIVEAHGSKGVNAEVAKVQTKGLEGIVSNYLKDHKIQITTVRENKTNEGYKEVFDIFVNGIEFKSLSFGQKVLVASAFCLAVMDLLSSKFRVLLLDEASVLSKDTFATIHNWCTKGEVDLIATKVADTNFTIKEAKK